MADSDKLETDKPAAESTPAVKPEAEQTAKGSVPAEKKRGFWVNLGAWLAVLPLVGVVFLIAAVIAFWPLEWNETPSAESETVEASEEASAVTAPQTPETPEQTAAPEQATQPAEAQMPAEAAEENTQAQAESGSDIALRLSALETHAGSFTDAEALTRLEARLANLEAALPSGLSQRLDSLAPRREVEDLERRLTRLETQNSTANIRRAAAILALADLATVAATDQDFVPQWEALNAFAQDDPALAALRQSAQTGVPTEAQLTERLLEDARVALDAEDAAVPRGFFARLWNNVVGLVSIRRIGDVEGEDSESRLARAQYALERGKLSEAVAEMAALQGPAREAMAPWLKDARARLTLEVALSEAKTRILASLLQETREEPAAP